MSEIFKQAEPNKGQESKVDFNEWWSEDILNSLSAKWMYTSDNVKKIQEAIASIKQWVDDFNTWVDKNLLVWKMWFSDKTDRLETLKWSKNVNIDDFNKELSTKIASLNNSLAEINSPDDLYTLRDNLSTILNVEWFVNALPSSRMLWDWELVETVVVENTQEQSVTQNNLGDGIMWEDYYRKWAVYWLWTRQH